MYSIYVTSVKINGEIEIEIEPQREGMGLPMKRRFVKLEH